MVITLKMGKPSRKMLKIIPKRKTMTKSEAIYVIALKSFSLYEFILLTVYMTIAADSVVMLSLSKHEQAAKFYGVVPLRQAQGDVERNQRHFVFPFLKTDREEGAR